MAEEGTLGQARASHETDDDEVASKQELQRRMEEARETITQTVTEIKETVTNQYYSMKETVSDALDWRYHFRRNPVAFSLGALSVGALVGYGLAGALKGDSSNDREGYPSADESDVYARTNATPSRYEDERESAARHSAFHGGSFAAQPITDGSHETPDYVRGTSAEAEDDDESNVVRISQGGSYSYSAPREEQTPEKPGLFERFKGTPTYDRLQTEVSTLGDRFIEELSSTAHNVVLPALFNKIKEMFGVDLSGKQGQQSQGNRQSQDAAPANAGARAASASASGSSGSSYGTSENRGYGAQSAAQQTDKGGEESSVLDLDR
jgi:hypothetical protein